MEQPAGGESQLTATACILQTIKWVEAVTLQSRRVFELLEVFNELRAHKDSEDHELIDALNRRLDGLAAEEHFFLIAVAKSNAWINLSTKMDAVSNANVRKYRQLIEPALSVRNMREHDDKYLTGEGDNQDKFVHEDRVNGGVALSIDGTSSSGSVERWMLGGRVDIRKISDEASKVIDVLKDALKTKRAEQSAELKKFLSGE